MKLLLFLLALLRLPLFAQLPPFTGTVSSSGGVTTSNLNGVYNPVACGTAPVPSWCSGPDIGAWINAAIAAGANRLFVPAGKYSQSTTIMLPRNVLLTCAQSFATQITYASSAGWAVIVADTFGDTLYAGRGGIED